MKKSEDQDLYTSFFRIWFRYLEAEIRRFFMLQLTWNTLYFINKNSSLVQIWSIHHFSWLKPLIVDKTNSPWSISSKRMYQGLNKVAKSCIFEKTLLCKYNHVKIWISAFSLWQCMQILAAALSFHF